MTDGHHLYIPSDGSVNPIIVKIPQHKNPSKIFLNRVVFKGVPTTAGIPNSFQYSLKAEDSQNLRFDQVVRTDGMVGSPIPLKGSSYTDRQLNPPYHIGTLDPDSHSATFKIRVLDQDGADAVYSDCAFWFLIK